MPTYNKLVRDRIPEVIEATGKSFSTRILDENEYQTELRRKMHEEINEYVATENNEDALEELADLLELIHAAATVHGATFSQLEELRTKKAEKRGGFNERIFLIEVDDE